MTTCVFFVVISTIVNLKTGSWFVYQSFVTVGGVRQRRRSMVKILFKNTSSRDVTRKLRYDKKRITLSSSEKSSWAQVSSRTINGLEGAGGAKAVLTHLPGSVGKMKEVWVTIQFFINGR